MSSSIVYHAVGIKLPPAMTGQAQDLFVIAAQVGDSNVYEHGGRRARSWSALHFGTHDDVLADAIALAGGFEGGGLKLDRYRGGDVPPERYIGRARRLLAAAHDNDLSSGWIPFKGGHVSVALEKRGPGGYSDRELIAWDEKERAHGFIAETLADAKRGRAYNYFRVYGPELR